MGSVATVPLLPGGGAVAVSRDNVASYVVFVFAPLDGMLEGVVAVTVGKRVKPQISNKFQT